jgi:hypothetical protein
MRTVKLLVQAATMCAGLIGLVSEARADFTVAIDCYGVDGQPNWADTSNHVTVQARINGVWTQIAHASVTDCGYTNSFRIYKPGFEVASVDAVRVNSNGSDAFWMDTVELIPHIYGNAAVARWGQNQDGIGYCISDDHGDGHNAFCHDAEAYGQFTFYR